LIDEAVLERMAERLRSNPEKMKLWGQLVEHPFGTMKRGISGIFPDERIGEGWN